MKKKLIVVLGVVALLVVVVSISFSALAKNIVQSYASEVMRSQVRFSSFHISPFTGRGSLKNVFIGNPEGYKTESAFVFDTVDVKLDILSLLTETILVDEIVVKHAQITYEMGFSGSNLSTLQRNIENYGIDATTGKNVIESQSDNLVIKNFYLKDAKVSLAASGFGNNTQSIAIGDIHLENIAANDLDSPAGAIAVVIGSILDNVLKVIPGAAMKGLGAVKEKLKGMFD